MDNNKNISTEFNTKSEKKREARRNVSHQAADFLKARTENAKRAAGILPGALLVFAARKNGQSYVIQ